MEKGCEHWIIFRSVTTINILLLFSSLERTLTNRMLIFNSLVSANYSSFLSSYCKTEVFINENLGRRICSVLLLKG